MKLVKYKVRPVVNKLVCNYCGAFMKLNEIKTDHMKNLFNALGGSGEVEYFYICPDCGKECKSNENLKIDEITYELDKKLKEQKI